MFINANVKAFSSENNDSHAVIIFMERQSRKIYACVLQARHDHEKSAEKRELK
jgi:hypothetical protein